MSQEIKIHGTLLCAFLNAGESLKLLLRHSPDEIVAYDPNLWYSVDELQRLLRLVSLYKDHRAILEQIGMEMMQAWYRFGPGKEMISSGIDFLIFQSGSDGFRSVIQGPTERVGDFVLLEWDEAKGTALLQSTTIFPRDMERGVLKGGLGLVGDLLYYDVDNSRQADLFHIFFVSRKNRQTLSWHSGDALEEIEWRFKHYRKQTEEKENFWHGINETLNASYAEMQKTLSQLKILRGMLPICASCKKIRDDRGYWNQIEAYIHDHSEAEFSHSLCPECVQKLYKEL